MPGRHLHRARGATRLALAASLAALCPNAAGHAQDAPPGPPEAAPRDPPAEPADAPEPPAAPADALDLPAEPEAAPLDLPAEPDAEESEEPVEAPIRYLLERVVVEGNRRSAAHVVRNFIHLRPGDVLDVDDPDLEAVRWRLLGTGWFQDVQLRLERGSARGRVVLVVRVSERNTLVLRQVAFGVGQSVERTEDGSPQLEPYLGLSVADRNLFGQGLELGVSTLVSAPQWGLHLDLTDPFLFGSRFAGHLSLFVNDAREFFGDDPRVGAEPDIENVVLSYRRLGLRAGTGVDVSRWTRVSADLQLEAVDVGDKPPWASTRVGDAVRPIDFDVLDGPSVLSLLDVAIRFERRDDPALPSTGTLVDVRAALSSRVFGSDYEFLKLELLLRQWVKLPWGHHLRFGLFGGIVFGSAPFFLQFYAADLSDLIPSRVLEMNVDRRPAPNFFDTAIAEARIEEVAGRVDVEYGLPLHRSASGPVYRVDAYAGAGLYALTDRRNLQVAVSGYEGLSRIPVDLTFDLGLRIDSEVGVLQIGLSTVLGFVGP